METRGKTLLKVIGILMIIFGGIGAVVYLMGMLGGGLLLAGSAVGGLPAAEIVSGIVIFVFAFSLIWSVMQLITGIIGVKNCANPAKAGVCFKLGIVLIVFSLISSAGQIWQNGFSAESVCSLIIGLILPGLFCYGAKLNKKQ